MSEVPVEKKTRWFKKFDRKLEDPYLFWNP